jgi:large subunit ribosomal protein L18
MKKTQAKTAGRIARHARIRAKVHGTQERPRLAVFRSNQFLYAQLINDDTATTLAAADTRKEKGATRTEKAVSMATTLAEKAKKAGVSAVTFDRGGFPYKGSIKAFAEAAREAGLQF